MFKGLTRAKLKLAALSGLVVASVGIMPASAHHGGGTFDPNRCFVFTGTVRQLAWTNPHSWIYVTVPRANGASELWGFEFGTIAGLARAGLRPSTFPAGTRVTVTAHVNRDRTKKTGASSRLVLPDGRVVGGADAQGTVPTGATSACPAY